MCRRFNTHCQSNYDIADFPFHSDIRMAQLRECAAFMRRKVLEHDDAAVRRFPVLFGGDFNVNARPNAASPASQESPSHSQEYVAMLDVLACFNGERPRDVMFEQVSSHPITIFDSTKEQREAVLTPSAIYDTFEADGRLDYIFMFDNANANDVSNELSNETCDDARLEEFGIEPSPYFPGHQLSDHYGISMAL